MYLSSSCNKNICNKSIVLQLIFNKLSLLKVRTIRTKQYTEKNPCDIMALGLNRWILAG